MKRKNLKRGLLNLFVAVAMLITLAIGFAVPVSAQIPADLPPCENPQCLNPTITICAGTEFNEQLLIDAGVTCDPVPGGPYPAVGAEAYPGLTFTITRSFDFLQNPIPNNGGADLEGTAPVVPGTYYYHVFCVKTRFYNGEFVNVCTCASVGNIFVKGCTPNADDFSVCVGTVLDDDLFITEGNVSCTGEGCELKDIEWDFNTLAAGGPYPYTVTCNSTTCGDVTETAFVTVTECGGGCLCESPDLTVCQGYLLTEQDFINAGVACPSENCTLTLDFSAVNTMVPGIYTYTVHCGTTTCSGAVTVTPACLASAPDITMCQYDNIEEALAKALAGCSEGCESYIDLSQVPDCQGNACMPGCFPYTVNCTDPCGGDCGNSVASGTICVLPCLDVEIIEAAGQEKYVDDDLLDPVDGAELNPAWIQGCDSLEKMIVPVSSDFGIKAVIGNCSGCLLYDVTPYIIIEGPAELIPGMPDHWNLGNMEGGADADSTEVAWTLHCTGPGEVKVTVTVNNCAIDTVCFDQRFPADMTLTCASPCEVTTKCRPGYTNGTFNHYMVTAQVCNNGQTEIYDAAAVLSLTGPATLSGNPQTIGTLAPGQCASVQWEITVTGEGDVNFTVTATGKDRCGDIALLETCTSTTRQRDALIDVTAHKVSVTTPCNTDNTDCLTVSVGQHFDIVSTIKNGSDTNMPFSATLNLPAGSAIVPGSMVDLYSPSWPPGQQTQHVSPNLSVAGKATVTMSSPTLCQCCTVTITWHLVCTASTGGDCITGTCAPYSVDATVCNKPYSSLPCNPASVCQETPADLNAYIVGPFVKSCTCDDMVKVDVVAVGQFYDAQICVTNSGEADATNVQVQVVISQSTTCNGTYTIDFGTIPGGQTVCKWLSDAINCELQCTDEEKAVIQISSITGFDENTCGAISGPITELCGLDFPQCDVDVEIINPEEGAWVEQWEVFAVKARINNCGTCNFEDVTVTLQMTGPVELVEGSANPQIIDLIEAPCDDCGEDCRYEEVTWMVRCVGLGPVSFDVCVESANPHLVIQTLESTTVYQYPRDLALVCVDILSPDNGSKYATSEDFAITAEISNLECCAPVTISEADICVGGIPMFDENIDITSVTPALPWVIQPGETKVVTWTAHCTGSGLSWFNVHLEGVSDEYEPVYAWSEPVTVWQYPAAHLEVTIDDYPEQPVAVGTGFDVTFTVTNTGEADATNVYVTLSSNPAGSVRIAGPSEGGYRMYIGTIPGHDSEANSVTRTYTLTSLEPFDSTIEITASGNDEYGWHMKQVCASTGSFIIEGGFETVEELTEGFIDDSLVVDSKGWFYGVFFGDANGLIGPFNATSPISYVVDGTDYTGEVALMGAVIPNVSMMNAEMLSSFMCQHGNCQWNPDCNFQCMCDLIQGKDVMVYIGHITSDTPFDPIADTTMWVGPGLINIINGQLSGSFIEFSPQYDDVVKSLLGGQYCSDMAATAGLPIQAGFIESDEVTVRGTTETADLSLLKASDTCCYTMGEIATFTVSVSNNGPSDATNVMVQDVLPVGLSFDGVVVSQGWYDETSGFWSVGNLDNGDTATLTITAIVDTVGEVTNRATVMGMDEHDPVMANNSDTAVINAEEGDPVTSVTLHLDQGQNLISLPLMPDVTNPVTALAGVNFDVAAMMTGSSKTSFSFKTYISGGVPGAGFGWTDGYGYWLGALSSGQTLTIAGKELPTGTTLPPSYDVAGGWNLIGFKSTTAKLPSEYLAGIAGKYVMIYGYDNGAFYAVGTPGHAMLQPGFGYWLAVKVGESGTIFP